jgi:hypothetical protein
MTRASVLDLNKVSFSFAPTYPSQTSAPGSRRRRQRGNGVSQHTHGAHARTPSAFVPGRPAPSTDCCSLLGRRPQKREDAFDGVLPERRIVIRTQQELSLALRHTVFQDIDEDHRLLTTIEVVPLHHLRPCSLDGDRRIGEIEVLKTRWETLMGEVDPGAEAHILQLHPREVVAPELVAFPTDERALILRDRPVEERMPHPAGEDAVDQLDPEAEPVAKVDVAE